MSYFLQAGTDIEGYDPAFKKYYKRPYTDYDIQKIREKISFGKK